MLVNRNGKKLILAMALFFAVAAAVIVYSQQSPEKSPDCKCVYPNTKEYGVIKNGKCVVTKCKRKAPEKTSEK